MRYRDTECKYSTHDYLSIRGWHGMALCACVCVEGVCACECGMCVRRVCPVCVSGVCVRLSICSKLAWHGSDCGAWIVAHVGSEGIMKEYRHCQCHPLYYLMLYNTTLNSRHQSQHTRTSQIHTWKWHMLLYHYHSNNMSLIFGATEEIQLYKI